jgi:hypothetical protein
MLKIYTQITLFVVVVVVLKVLGFELRASHLLDRTSTTLATSSAVFALVILKIGSCSLPRPA